MRGRPKAARRLVSRRINDFLSKHTAGNKSGALLLTSFGLKHDRRGQWQRSVYPDGRGLAPCVGRLAAAWLKLTVSASSPKKALQHIFGAVKVN